MRNFLVFQRFISFVSILLFSYCGVVCLAQTTINNSAKILVGDKPLYTSQSTFVVQGSEVSRTISYYDNAKKLLRQETVQYNNRSLEIVSVKQEDFRMGFLQTIQKQGKSYIIKQRKNASEAMSESSSPASGVYSSQLFIQILQQRMDALLQGKEQKFEILVASRNMNVEMLATKERTETVQGVACVVVKTEPSSLIYRALAEPSYFYFEQAQPHRLIYYKGILGITDEKGGQISGTTVSSY